MGRAMTLRAVAGWRSWVFVLAFVAAAFLRSSAAEAQSSTLPKADSTAPDPHAVQPERPTVATHAYTVAPGWVEIETGVERDDAGGGATALGIPTEVKVGLTR